MNMFYFNAEKEFIPGYIAELYQDYRNFLGKGHLSRM